MILINKETYEVKETSEKGKGLFCKKKLKKGTIIGDYLGQIVKIEEYDLEKDKEGLYLMFLDDRYAIYSDLTKIDIHLMNHSCDPNCFMYIYKKHTLFVAIKNIDAGQEMTIHYLLPPKNKTCFPCTHFCKCQSPKCTGTMHLEEKKFEKWQEYLDTLSSKDKTKIKYFPRSDFKPLKHYPNFVLINKKMLGIVI